MLAESQRLGGGGGYWAVVTIFVVGLFAVGAIILYKFKRQDYHPGLVWAGSARVGQRCLSSAGLRVPSSGDGGWGFCEAGTPRSFGGSPGGSLEHGDAALTWVLEQGRDPCWPFWPFLLATSRASVDSAHLGPLRDHRGTRPPFPVCLSEPPHGAQTAVTPPLGLCALLVLMAAARHMPTMQDTGPTAGTQC